MKAARYLIYVAAVMFWMGFVALVGEILEGLAR